MEGLSTFSLREILQEPPEEADWIIEDLITTGLHLLVGPPKAGKSWLALDMAISVAQGESFLGFATAKSDVLYLALEDTRNRLKTRSWKLIDETNGELDFATAAAKVSGGLIPQIEDYLAAHAAVKLVIVDTFQMVREPSRDSAYAADYADLTPLKKLADANGIAVVVVHHTRKMGDACLLRFSRCGVPRFIGAPFHGASVRACAQNRCRRAAWPRPHLRAAILAHA